MQKLKSYILQVEQPRLHQIVTTRMLHNLCHNKKDAPCKVDNRCTKEFPKRYEEETIYQPGNIF